MNEPELRALIANDRAVLAVLEGDTEQALQGFQAALALDEQCEPARANGGGFGDSLRNALLIRRVE